MLTVFDEATCTVLPTTVTEGLPQGSPRLITGPQLAPTFVLF
jgi:hypothetical protein